ncbi:polysaccharide pyruvyl transferase family protein [Saccharopolyspora gregorii]|uniref:polysaccharide pyruvyl transferase family protein n=1 Tax=Saccharopolyspora gregorii TaxID=33914 RepID=UPI0021AC5D2B|nr:polysaccharide pyruvyl transferase family protein [Saccharopolyspora gregorii]
MRVLVLGWASFLHGEATAGDVAAAEAVAGAAASAGFRCDVAWSPGFRPGELTVPEAARRDYDVVVFACGPLHGAQVREVHRLFPRARRIAVGASVLDWSDPAVTGFHRVLPRDAPGSAPAVDLAAEVGRAEVPVAGIVLAGGQPEYGGRGRHEDVHRVLRSWVAGVACAPVELDTRLDPGSWHHCGTPERFAALVARTDVVVTTRLHGLVFALGAGVPALAVDPVRGGGKVAAQATAWGWPAVAAAEEVLAGSGVLDARWAWCTSARGARRAGELATGARRAGITAVLAELRAAAPAVPAPSAGS